MNCLTCLNPLKIRVVVPEEEELQGLDPSGYRTASAASNSFCSACGIAVPVAHARLILAAQVRGA
jgi:hypothetical protein